MKREGFTLIELLVVIAIIGILAAMLFPVFARARESARKIQCLSNVKNVAIAIQMYPADWYKFWPSGMHDQAMQVLWDETHPGGSGTAGDTCWKTNSANPFVRAPVILDEYIKNRDVWRCPSAQNWVGADWIVPSYTSPWWQYLMDTQGHWGRANANCGESGGGGPCCEAWPPGWGGTVTDSIGQVAMSTENTGAFECTEGVSDQVVDVSTSRMLDPSWLVVCGDTMHFTNFGTVDGLLYSLCATSSGKADWENCPDTQDCGLDQDLVQKWATDPSFPRKYTRHLGGSNTGFADGHAREAADR